jgi:hypothetical protein
MKKKVTGLIFPRPMIWTTEFVPANMPGLIPRLSRGPCSLSLQSAARVNLSRVGKSNAFFRVQAHGAQPDTLAASVCLQRLSKHQQIFVSADQPIV